MEENLVHDSAIIFFKMSFTNVVGRHNRKFVYGGYMDTYSTTLGFWLHEMQLVLAHMCSEYTWSLLNKLWTACRAARPVSVFTGHVYVQDFGSLLQYDTW